MSEGKGWEGGREEGNGGQEITGGDGKKEGRELCPRQTLFPLESRNLDETLIRRPR